MRKKLFCVALLSLTAEAVAAIPNADTANLTYTLSYESYNLPVGLDRLGVVNLGAFYHFNPLFYGGMQLDSAVRGNLGGFYALGLNGGIEYPLVGAFVGRTGTIIGGGGGHDISQAVGGGFFYEPYIGLDYHFSKMALGLQYSYICFPGGALSSSQIGLQLSAPLNLSYTDFSLRNQHLPGYAATSSESLYFSLLDTEVFPNQGMRNTQGTLMDDRFNMIGFDMGKYATSNSYYFLRVLGEVQGPDNGFAALLGGAGYQYPIYYKTELFADLGVGGAGGGRVDTGGGFVYMPTLGLRYQVTSDVGLSASGSLLNSTEGALKSKAVSLGLRYSFDHVTDVHLQTNNSLAYQGWQIRVFNQTYLKPTSSAQETLPSMQLLAAQLNFYVKPYLYLAAQTAFAYHGQDAGGYFTGMFGPGLSTAVGESDRWSVYGQTLLGAAGGGGLDIGGGAMVQPEAGLEYQLTHQLGLQLGAGRLIALKGKFNSTVLSLGVESSFSTLS